MSLALALAIFWICGILWGAIYWFGNDRPSGMDRKVFFGAIPERTRSATSIDSLEISDNDDIGRDRGRNIRRKREIRTRR